MIDVPNRDERTWGMLCHLGIFIGHFIPLGNFLAPLIIWLMKREESDFVNHHGKESLNFQISIFIYLAIAFVFTFVLIGFPFLIGLWIFSLVIVIIAGLKANDGQYYRYPLTIRFIK